MQFQRSLAIMIFSFPPHLVIKFIFARIDRGEARTDGKRPPFSRIKRGDLMRNQFTSRGGHYNLARSKAAMRPHKTTEIRIVPSHLPSLSLAEMPIFFS